MKKYCKDCTYWSALLAPTYCGKVIGRRKDKEATRIFGRDFGVKRITGDFRKLNKNNDCKFYEKYIDYEKEALKIANLKPKWYRRLLK